MSKKVVTLDVREDIQRGREPFAKIMQAIAKLKDNESLLLIAPFEPVPLFGVLAQRGFSHQSQPSAAGDWEVLFTRGNPVAVTSASPVTAPSASGPKRSACSGPPVLAVDARGLEPPEPLIKILEAVAALPAGAHLRAYTDRRPMHLYAQLEERGFVGETEEQSDGSFITLIRPC